jgi:hypothetical protein
LGQPGGQSGDGQKEDGTDERHQHGRRPPAGA